MTLPAFALAGYYQAGTTSGLSVSVTGGGGTSLTPGNGSITGAAGGGGGSGKASGTISTTFTWVRNTIYGGEADPNDNPPDTVIVVENCNTSATASAYGYSGGPSTSANNGLGTNTVNTTTPIYQTLPYPPYQIQIGETSSSVCNGSRAQIVAGGQTVTVNDDIVSGSAASSSGPFGTGVTYSVSVTPVILTVNGTVNDDGTLYGEVGRLHSGTLSAGAPGTTLGLFSWSVGGSDAFSTYEHDTVGLVTYLSSATLTSASPAWHWRRAASETVSVSATVYFNGSSIGSVYESKDVDVEAPTPVWSGITASGLSRDFYWGLASNGNASCVSPGGDPVGMYYSFGGTKCPHFPNGTLFNAQLVDAYWYYDGTLWDRWSSTNGAYYLDTSYPYDLTYPTYDPTILKTPSTTTDEDTPNYGGNQPGAVQVTTSFQTNLMYRSSDPSEQDVTLYFQTWFWNGSSTTSPPPSSPTSGSGGALTYQPQWDNVFSG
jgi:hypothetical protein